MSLKTIYAWRTKYAGLSASEVARLKQLEEENRTVKQTVAERSPDKQMLQDVLRKKGGDRPCGATRSVGRSRPTT